MTIDENALRPLALDAAEHLLKMKRDGFDDDNCLSEGADVILEAFEKMLGLEKTE